MHVTKSRKVERVLSPTKPRVYRAPPDHVKQSLRSNSSHEGNSQLPYVDNYEICVPAEQDVPDGSRKLQASAKARKPATTTAPGGKIIQNKKQDKMSSIRKTSTTIVEIHDCGTEETDFKNFPTCLHPGPIPNALTSFRKYQARKKMAPSSPCPKTPLVGKNQPHVSSKPRQDTATTPQIRSNSDVKGHKGTTLGRTEANSKGPFNQVLRPVEARLIKKASKRKSTYRQKELVNYLQEAYIPVTPCRTPRVQKILYFSSQASATPSGYLRKDHRRYQVVEKEHYPSPTRFPFQKPMKSPCAGSSPALISFRRHQARSPDLSLTVIEECKTMKLPFARSSPALISFRRHRAKSPDLSLRAIEECKKLAAEDPFFSQEVEKLQRELDKKILKVEQIHMFTESKRERLQ